MFLVLLIYITFSTQNVNRFLSNQSSFFYSEDSESECYLDQSFSSSIYSNSAICIIRCTFNFLKSQSDGGAVIISLRNRFCLKNLIDQCFFNECQSNNGGAIYINIEKNVTTEIQNSIFKKILQLNHLVVQFILNQKKI